MNMKGKRQKAKGKRKIQIGFAIYCLLPVALCLLLSACGSKGALRTPEGAVPEPIKDLKAKAGNQGIDITWTRPSKYIDGKELNDLAGFIIFRKEISKACPECPVPYRERAIVNVEDQQKYQKRKQYGFVDQELQPQTIYRYRVFSKVMDDSLSDPSNEAEAAWKP
jgi:predicted small lipoprotein YifL